MEGKKIVKVDLIQQLCVNSGLTVPMASKVVNTFFDVMRKAMLNGEKITIQNWGAFRIKVSPDRVKYDPHRRIKIQVPESKKISFSLSKQLAEEIQGREW